MPRHLMSHAEAKRRKQEKHLAGLRFLSQTIYSTPAILGHVMGLNTSAGWYTTLRSMERDGLVMPATVDVFGRRVPLWGITPQGQAVAHHDGAAPLSDRYFQPSRVPPTFLFHSLGLQQLHLKALAAGWTEWSYRDTESGRYAPDKYRPDVIARHPGGHRYAIEYERTVKTPGRYPGILRDHFVAITLGLVDRIGWVCDGTATLYTVARHILSVRELQNAEGQRRVIGAKHHARLFFAAIQDFPVFLASTRENFGPAALEEVKA